MPIVRSNDSPSQTCAGTWTVGVAGTGLSWSVTLLSVVNVVEQTGTAALSPEMLVTVNTSPLEAPETSKELTPAAMVAEPGVVPTV